MIPQFNPLSSFYPLSLFANGEPGFWLDPSDFTTMFTDAAGTTPVTAVEQPVGLILDKSKGLVLGADIVTNGQFATDTGWTKSPGVTISGGKLNFTAVLGSQGATQGAGTIPAGGVYLATITIDSISAGGIRYQIGSYFAAGMNYTTPGTYVARVWAGATAGDIEILAVGTTTAVISSFSLKKIAGTHYTQSTAGVRPVLSARVNGLIKSEDYADAYWIKQQVAAGTIAITPAQGIAPNGTNTASQIVFTAPTTSDLALLQGAFTTVNAQPYKSGIYLKAFSTGDVGKQLLMRGASGGGYTLITLTNSWVFAATTESSASSGAQYFVLGLRPVLGGSSGTVSVLAWGADARPSDQATGLIPTYQRVNTSTDYDTAGFPLYLSGNGTQWMQCASQDYTGVNKMLVCSGFRKLSDAAAGVVIELSVGVTSNNGSFLIDAPDIPASKDIGVYLRGSATQSKSIATAGVIAPVTLVLSNAFALATSGTTIANRINGADVNSSTNSPGAVNFGNYPAYIFARAGSSLFLTGNIYQLIARGSTVASNAAQIASTESWTDLKTKAY